MSFEKMMQELHEEYIANLPEKILTIETLHACNNIEGLESAFHKIKGTGKTYGVPELSTLARLVEQICKENKNVQDILPKSISLLKQIESSRRVGNEFKIETEADYLDIQKLAA